MVTVKTGPLIALDDLLLGIPMPLKFENPEAQLHSWKLDVRDTKRNVKLKTYQGSGQPPGQLEWTPEKPDLPAKPQQEVNQNATAQASKPAPEVARQA